MPKVSVIMNCLNGEKYLAEAIDSVYGQTFADWEIVFWDNASTDGSKDIAGRYDHRLRCFGGATTESLGRARNLAIAEARGECLAILDCDDVWLATKLEKQLPFFANPEIGIVFSDVIHFNDRGYSRVKYGKRQPPQGRVFGILGPFNNYLCMSTVMVRSAAIKECGAWFDERFTALEDTDLFIRISKDWQIAYAPFVLCRYRMHRESASFSIPAAFFRETELMLDKMKSVYPDLWSLYGRGYTDELVYYKGIVEWRQGRNAIAREVIRPIRFKTKRYLLAYWAMHFPYERIQTIRATLGRQAIARY